MTPTGCIDRSRRNWPARSEKDDCRSGAIGSAWESLSWRRATSRKAPELNTLIGDLATNESRDLAWFFPGDGPPPVPGSIPDARSARVIDRDGRAGVVEHDGTCYLILNRAYDVGWRTQVCDEPEGPVYRVDGDIQAIPLVGSATTRVSVHFEPPMLRASAAISIVATLAALAVAGGAYVTGKRIEG